MGQGHAEIAGQRLRVVHDRAPAASSVNAEAEHDEQRNRHDNGLYKVGGRSGEETAGCRVADNDDGRNNHCPEVIHPEQAGEQLTAGGEARSGVRDEKDQNDQCGQAHQDTAFIAKAVVEEIGNGDGIAGDVRVQADTLGDDKPVDIGADGQADCRPTGVRDAGQIGQAGQTHEQPRTHVRGFGAHGGDERAKFTAAQVKVIGIVVLSGTQDTDIQHSEKINNYRHRNADLCGCHVNKYPFLTDFM